MFTFMCIYNLYTQHHVEAPGASEMDCCVISYTLKKICKEGWKRGRRRDTARLGVAAPYSDIPIAQPQPHNSFHDALV